MHNVLAQRYPVRVLKCLPLHPIQNRSRYAYRDIRFCTDDKGQVRVIVGKLCSYELDDSPADACQPLTISSLVATRQS